MAIHTGRAGSTTHGPRWLSASPHAAEIHIHQGDRLPGYINSTKNVQPSHKCLN